MTAIISAPFASEIVTGQLTETSTTAATTFLTIAAGETWEGDIVISAGASETAAGTAAGVASGVVATAGAGVTPAAGTIAQAEAITGANAAGGTAGNSGAGYSSTHQIIRAPGANSVTLTLTTFNAGTSSYVSVTASGKYIDSDIGR